MVRNHTLKRGKRIFLGLSFASLLSLIVISVVTWYLIFPRLQQFYVYLPHIVGWIAAAFLFLLTIGMSLIILTVKVLTAGRQGKGSEDARCK